MNEWKKGTEIKEHMRKRKLNEINTLNTKIIEKWIKEKVGNRKTNEGAHWQ